MANDLRHLISNKLNRDLCRLPHIPHGICSDLGGLVWILNDSIEFSSNDTRLNYTTYHDLKYALLPLGKHFCSFSCR